MSTSSHCQRVIERAWFHRGVVALILLSAVVIGLETDQRLMHRYGSILIGLDRVILGFFVLEIVLRIGARWPQPLSFFRDPWSVFDFAVVAVCLLPVHAEYAAVLRLARVLRVLRLITAVPRLQILVGALLKSVPSMGYVVGLLLLIFYVFAVVGVGLFRAADREHFGTLGAALLTLFQIVTLEGWVDLMKTQLAGGAPTWIVVPYFVSFILIGTMVMLNLLIGVIVNGMDEARKETEAQSHAADHDAAGGAANVRAKLAAAQQQLRALADELETAGRRLRS